MFVRGHSLTQYGMTTDLEQCGDYAGHVETCQDPLPNGIHKIVSSVWTTPILGILPTRCRIKIVFAELNFKLQFGTFADSGIAP